MLLFTIQGKKSSFLGVFQHLKFLPISTERRFLYLKAFLCKNNTITGIGRCFGHFKGKNGERKIGIYKRKTLLYNKNIREKLL